MVLLALDQATRTSGFSVWQDNQLIAYSKFTFDDENTYDRIHKVCVKIRELCDKYYPDHIAIENIQMQNGCNNTSTYHTLAQLQGAIIETTYLLNIPFSLISSSEWRKQCGLLKGQDKHRENQKKIAQQWVLSQFNQKCTQDEADAICLGYATTMLLNDNFNWEE